MRACVMAVLSLLLAVIVCSAQTPAYLVGGNNRVHIYSVANDSPIETMRLGEFQGTPAVSPNGRLLYANSIIGFMSLADVAANAELARIPGFIHTPAVSADGTRIVITQSDIGHSKLPDVLIVDAATLATQSYSLASLLCDTATPPNCDNTSPAVVAGNFAYFETSGPVPAGIVAFNLSTFQASSIPGVPEEAGPISSGGADATQAGITADGQFAVLVQDNPDALFVLATASNTLVAAPVLTMTPASVATSSVGGNTFVFVSGTDYNTGAPEIQVFTLTSIPSPVLTLVQTYSYPNNLQTASLLALSPDGNRLYAAAGGDTTLVVLDASSPVSALPVLKQINIPDGVFGLAAANLQLTEPPSAPSPTAVSPNTVINNDTDSNRTVQIFGGNFASDAMVRFGNAALVPGTLNGSTLAATVPPQTASQPADVVVTNRNAGGAVGDLWATAVLHNQLVISGPTTFQPLNQVAVQVDGDSQMVLLNASTNAGLPPAISETLPDAGSISLVGLGITPDGSTAYTQNFLPPDNVVIPVDLDHQAALPAIQLFPPTWFTGVGGQEDEVAVVPSSPVTASHGPAAYVVAAQNNGACPPCTLTDLDQVVTVIDADPGTATTPNPAYNTIVRQMSAGLALQLYLPGGVAVTPDGRYVYTSTQESVRVAGWSFFTNVGSLAIFDLVGGQFANPSSETLGAAGFQGHIEVSPDGNWLLLTAADGGILVFDISDTTNGNNRLAPVFRGEIRGSAPAGFNAPLFSTFRIPQGSPQVLVAWDQLQNLMETFAFQPASLNFAQLGTVAIPGATSSRDEFGLDVTPDGKLAYALLVQEDDAAVVDISNPASPTLLTKMLVGLGPSSIAVRPGTATPASSSPDSTVTVSPLASVTISLTGSTGGSTTVTTTVIPTGSTPPPSGFQVGSIPVFYNLATTASFSTAVVCFTYDPTQVPSPEGSLKLAHYDSSLDSNGNVIGWVDVTLPGSPDTTTHTICGQVSSFSPFVIGIASPTFLFNTLLEDISVLPSSETPVGIMRGLRAKVLAARASHSKGNDGAAINQLNALIAELNSISGSQITAADASKLINEANVLIGEL